MWVRGLVTWGSDCRLYGVLVFGETPENFIGLFPSVKLSSFVMMVVGLEVVGGEMLLLNKLMLLLSCVLNDDVIAGCIFCTCWVMADRSS